MERELPTKEQILGFLERNRLEAKDLMEITGVKNQVYEWLKFLRGEKTKTMAFPWEIWLLLNALFDRKAPFVAGIIEKYGRGEAQAAFLMEQSVQELRLNTRKEIEEKIEALRTLKCLEREFELIMKEEKIELIHAEHFARMKDLYYTRRGVHGVRIRNRELFELMRKAENELNIETAVSIQRLENLKEEFGNNKDGSFVKRLLEIYDEYIEQLEEARAEKYYLALVAELQAKERDRLQNKEREANGKPQKQKNYLLNTPEQKEAIERLARGSPFADMDMDRSGVVTPLRIREHKKKRSGFREKEDD